MSDRRWRWLLAAASGLLVVLPLLCVTYPPSVDLPQHVAQVRLFAEALRHPDGLYRIQWQTPYAVATLLLGLIWPLAGPLATGRVGLIVIGLLSTAATHWLAARRQRPAEAAVLASLPYLGLSLYHGFVSFIAGWPVFLVWLELTTRPEPLTGRRWALALLGCGLLLYYTHALWFAVALGWLAIAWLIQRPGWRVVVWQTGSLAPLALVAALWWLTLPSSGFEQPPQWQSSPLARLSPISMAGAIFAGVHGPLDLCVFGAMAVWCAVGLWRSRRSLRRDVDRPLLAAAAMFALVVLLAPNRISFTVYLNDRFAAPAATLALLAMPPLRLNAWIPRLTALAIAAMFSTLVAREWVLYERDDLTGFTAALDAVPPDSRVLGLDFVQFSQHLQSRPFVHQTAYTQVVKGGTLGFSFAEMPSPLVVFRDWWAWKKWQPNLEWDPERTTRDDVAYFDYVLVGAREEAHPVIAGQLGLSPVTTSGLWRLYRSTRTR